jgi:hypothetical protein
MLFEHPRPFVIAMKYLSSIGGIQPLRMLNLIKTSLSIQDLQCENQKNISDLILLNFPEKTSTISLRGSYNSPSL